MTPMQQAETVNKVTTTAILARKKITSLQPFSGARGKDVAAWAADANVVIPRTKARLPVRAETIFSVWLLPLSRNRQTKKTGSFCDQP